MKKSILRQYARLIARTGAHIQKGQQAVVYAELDQPDFVTMVVEECYKAGASKVEVEWSHQALQLLHTRYRSLKTLCKVEDWEIERLRHRTETLPARIYLLSEDPDGLSRIRKEKYAKSMRARSLVAKPFRDAADNRYPWCIAAVPGEKWAKKLFPTLSRHQAVERLWQAILSASRVVEGQDAEQNWIEHNRILKDRCQKINALQLKSLHYTASNGTDLTVGLMPQAEFLGGGEETLSGQFYHPNIPSEEIFTTPLRGAADGVIVSSKPFSYRGQLIQSFRMRFEQGRVVEVDSPDAKQLLEQMLDSDEGARYLGECALVPFDSPINNSGLLFYNTLFDENAVCHLALGAGFNNCVRDYDQYTLEELRQMGVNDSIIHEDIMIGTADLNIDGVTIDGKTVAIFRNGSFAL